MEATFNKGRAPHKHALSSRVSYSKVVLRAWVALLRRLEEIFRGGHLGCRRRGDEGGGGEAGILEEDSD